MFWFQALKAGGVNLGSTGVKLGATCTAPPIVIALDVVVVQAPHVGDASTLGASATGRFVVALPSVVKVGNRATRVLEEPSAVPSATEPLRHRLSSRAPGPATSPLFGST